MTSYIELVEDFRTKKTSRLATIEGRTFKNEDWESIISKLDSIPGLRFNHKTLRATTISDADINTYINTASELNIEGVQIIPDPSSPLLFVLSGEGKHMYFIDDKSVPFIRIRRK